MNILHLLTSGGIGGIETLCKDIAAYSNVSNDFCFLFGEGRIYEQMKRLGFSIYSLSDNKKISFYKIKRLKEIAKKSDIIVVHHNDPYLEMYYLMLMKMYPEKKYVSMVHHCNDSAVDNLNYGIIKRSIKRNLVKKVFKKSNKLIFVSKAGLNSYTGDFHIEMKKTCIVYNGIRESLLEKGDESKKNKRGIIKILYVGRLVAIKGVDVFIDILPEIVALYDVSIDIVGDGECKKMLEQKVESLGLNDYVTFHGFKDDVTPYLSDADIFVYPSKTEIFGISLIEAMAFKCICVANNVGGIPEIISNGENGFLNIDNSRDGLKKNIVLAIESVLNDSIRSKIIVAAKKTAEDFSIKNTVDALEEVYEGLIG